MTDNIYKLTKKDIAIGAQTIKSAFTHDPLWKKLFDGEENEDIKRLAFFEIPLRQGIYYGNAYAPSSNLEGVGVVIPGKYAATSIWQMLRTGSFSAVARMGADLGKRVNELFKPLLNEHKEHKSKGDYLYINILGVSLEYQKKGFGGTILKAALEEGKEKKLPLYLETETEENVRFYEKHGFKITKTVTLPVVDHKMWIMVKEP